MLVFHVYKLQLLITVFLYLFIYLFFKELLTYLFIYLFILFLGGCVGSSFLCEGFLQLWQAGATLHRGAQAFHCRGLSCCEAQAPDAQAQQLWLTGSVVVAHGLQMRRLSSCGSRAQLLRSMWDLPRPGLEPVSPGRQILNHCATREDPLITVFKKKFLKKNSKLEIQYSLTLFSANKVFAQEKTIVR